ncbi:DUF3108 domain-containing protein [Endozoicomonas sp.]|uniref:DUF3108 domain-containing protein n=1 Tax=Endozoicomonas sp. TaxID=1892382 RepID=UPI002884FCCE|nr:DUF3108 domain-containing protein [Endozoicomonas sp.]
MKDSMATRFSLHRTRIFTMALVCALLVLNNSALAATTSKSLRQNNEKVKTPAFILKPYTATYNASIKGVPFGGSGERSLTKNSDGSWTLAFSADAAFFGMKENSDFLAREGQLISNQYMQQRTGLGKKPTEYASFDWKNNKVNWQQGDKQWSMNLKPETLDNLSYQLKLRMDLATASVKQLSYYVADDDEVYQRRFIVEGEEVLATDLGKLKTVRVKIQRENSNRATWIWFAKDHDYFLVKILQEEKGTAYTIDIKEASIDGKPLKKKQTVKPSERPGHP